MKDKAVEERYLELSDDKSNKFWAIMIFEKCHTVRYGKLGAVGRSQSRRFETAEDARRHAERQIASKLEKGYVDADNPLTYKSSPHEPAGAMQIAYYDADGDLCLVRRHYPAGHLAEVSYFNKDGRAARQAWFVDRAEEQWMRLINPWVTLDASRLNKRVVKIEKIVGRSPISYRLFDADGNEV